MERELLSAKHGLFKNSPKKINVVLSSLRLARQPRSSDTSVKHVQGARTSTELRYDVTFLGVCDQYHKAFLFYFI